MLSWFPRLSDLNPLKFFLWTHLKTNVYKTPVEDLDDLNTTIINEIELIENETFHDVFLETVNCLNLYIDVKGHTFE